MSTIDDLPSELTTTTRNAERDRWLRDYSFHKPGDATVAGTEPYIQGSTMSDMVMPLYHDVKVVADATNPQKIGGEELRVRAEADGVFRLGAVGASGSVRITASVGGGTILLGNEINVNGLRYQCNASNTYQDGEPVPIIGIDVGIATNQVPGVVMAWNPPPPGIATNAVVVQQPDGTGLTGGRDLESEDEYRDRWNREKAARAASGNDAEIIELAEKTSGIAVEKAYVIPTVLGPSTTCIVFTLQPATSGASRIPNATQRTAVLANVQGAMPATEGIFMAVLAAENVDVVLKVTWDTSTSTWSDLTPWPLYYAAAGQAHVVSTVTDATHFLVRTFNNSYAGVAQPAAGQSIAVYDFAQATFRRKKILSFTGTGPWTIVVDTSNGVSDEGYVPILGQRAMPWSESLQTLGTPLKAYFKTLGPGEQFASFFDAGSRQRRQPPSPKNFPSVITTTGLEGSLKNQDVPSVFDAVVMEPTLPRVTTIGTPATTCNLLSIGYLSVFPLP